MSFYAVANGRSIGVFLNWNECSESVSGFNGALYKKFETKEEAETFISSINNSKIKPDNDNDNDIDYFVYTDGACSNNGKPNSLAGIGIFFGIDDCRNVSEKIEGKQTNNCAELIAIIKTYNIIEKDIIKNKKITIVSDSKYAISCATYYGEKCHNTNYMNKNNIQIPNKKLVKEIYELYKDIKNVDFIHILAHTNNNDIHSIGNCHADKLANLAIGLETCPYNKIYQINDAIEDINYTDADIKEIKNDIKEIKNDIKEIKNNIKEITEILLCQIKSSD
tara:strand:- start:2444 stop:3280 length:837 start_codon:yes stop_codon:yes gene_type:complete